MLQILEVFEQFSQQRKGFTVSKMNSLDAAIQNDAVDTDTDVQEPVQKNTKQKPEILQITGCKTGQLRLCSSEDALAHAQKSPSRNTSAPNHSYG